MAVRKSTNKQQTQQPIHKAIGLMACCAVVVFGGWMRLRPETILLRAIVVGCVTTFLVKMVVSTVNSAFDPEEN